MERLTAANGVGAGLGTPAARWALCIAWALGVVHGLLAGVFARQDPWQLGAYACVLAGVFLVTRPGRGALDRMPAAGVAGCSLAAALLIFADGAPAGRIWLFDFASYLPALLVARGSLVIGVTGAALLVAIGGGGVLLAGGTPRTVAELIAIPVTALAVGVAWNVALRRIVARERMHRSNAARDALAAEIAEEAASRNRRELAAVRRQAAPLLTRLARGEVVDDRLRSELSATEAAIRDQIRFPWIPHLVLTAAISRRRRAGVAVLLLGESAGPRQPMSDGLARAVAALIDGLGSGSITIRALPSGRAGAVSVLLDDGAAATRVVLDGGGAVLSRD